jgi:UDP-N-acetyl-D-glucosamine dehydrogenase
MKVSVVGQGYVGLPLALALVNFGQTVFGIDLDDQLVDKVSSGISPITDLSNTQIIEALRSDRYKIYSNFDSIETSEVIIICVPTPLDEQKQPDLTFLISAIKSVAPRLQNGALIINESTVSPGTTRGLIKAILDGAEVDYDLAYSPERIDPANKKWNVVNTPKLVSGLTPAAAERAANFYRNFVEIVNVGSSLEVVETAKLLENSFRLVNISFINEIAQFCAALEIDVREVIAAAGTKPYGFMPFYPGVGVGGHCIPVDPMYLAAKAHELGVPTRFIDLAIDVNDSLASYFTGVAAGLLGGLKNKKILIVGIAYKSDVSDVRETRSANLIRQLRLKGADVAWHDELVKEWNGEKSSSLSSSYDLIILANPHSGTDLSTLGSIKILDTRGGYL